MFLERLRDKTFNMCEIGLDNCQSINLWREYFPKATIYGVDIFDKKFCENNLENVKTIIADQSSIDGINKIVDSIDMCDLIIDDGSHNPDHQVDTFKILFEKRLNYGGIYIIEDTEIQYWKKGASVYNYKYEGNKTLFNFFDKSYDLINEEFSKVKNELHISTLTYCQNCMIITKRNKEEIPICTRQYRFSYNQ
jgi:predicted secreted protein